MDKSLYRTLYLSTLIISVGFAVMEFMDNAPGRAALWLSGGCAVLVLLSMYRKKKNPQEKSASSKPLESVLPPEAAKKIHQGELPDLHTDLLMLEPQEKLVWMDQARQDHYEGKQGMLLLSDRRIIFQNPEFSFDHPIHLITLTKTRNGVELKIRQHKMKFVTASTPELIEVYHLIR